MRLRYNGLSASLGAALSNAATSITFAADLTHSGGVAVPTIGASDYIPLSILDSAGRLKEIVRLAAYTAGATTGTITRGQEGTAAVAHSDGARVVHSPTLADVEALAVEETHTFTMAGATSIQVGQMRLYADYACTIQSVRASVGTAPVGSSLLVDINKNGTTIFTTQAGRPTIAAGTFTDLATPDVTTLAAEDYLTIDVDQIGTTTPGSDLVVQVRVKKD